MSFYGCSFIYDGIPSEEFGVFVYDFKNVSQSDGTLGTEISISEDRINRLSTPLHYGIIDNSPLEFDLVFGSLEPLDRHDVAAIGGWLTGHSSYKKFVMVQSDMELYHYKAIITGIDIVPWSGKPIAFKAHIRCDSPYAYMELNNYSASIKSGIDAKFDNRSNVNRYYLPKRFEISCVTSGLSSNGLIIKNTTTGEEYKFTGLPKSNTVTSIVIDCNRRIITSSTLSNPYDYFNFVFPKFIRGLNTLSCSSPVSIEISRDFPMNIGS